MSANVPCEMILVVSEIRTRILKGVGLFLGFSVYVFFLEPAAKPRSKKEPAAKPRSKRGVAQRTVSTASPGKSTQSFVI